MNVWKFAFFCAGRLAVCALLLLTGCLRSANSMPEPTKGTDWLNVLAAPDDHSAAKAVEEALRSNQEKICRQLMLDCNFPVVVELYTSQASFDEHVMNPAFHGFYAVSGQGKIQMVSPNVSPAGRAVAYEDRVQIAVHEFVHLALDEINPDLPDWLDEGTAVYLGPHAIYDQACQIAFPFDNLPRLNDLVESYQSIPAADLYAFTLVRFMVERDGIEKLNQLLRSPARIAAYLENDAHGFDKEWRSFLRKTCSGPGKTEFQAVLFTPRSSESFAPQTCWFQIPEGARYQLHSSVAKDPILSTVIDQNIFSILVIRTYS